jgi:hypothetical protein
MLTSGLSFTSLGMNRRLDCSGPDLQELTGTRRSTIKQPQRDITRGWIQERIIAQEIALMGACLPGVQAFQAGQ